MASLPQISIPLGICSTSSNKNTTNTQPRIFSQLSLYKKTHFNFTTNLNLFANPTTSSFPLIRKQQCQSGSKWKARGSSNDDGSCGSVNGSEFLSRPNSPVDIVDCFYKAFNEKDTERLNQLISPKCVYQDLLFYSPYENQESIINFWQSVMDAMGPNIHISVDDIKESNHLMATALWHLQWKNMKIPFTNGCRFFTFEEIEGKLFISKITGLEELPVKPGELVLKLLKAISNLLDSYPLAAAAMLDSHASQDGSKPGGADMHFDLFGRKH